MKTHGTLRTKILEYLQNALMTTKKLFTLAGQNFTIDNHIPVLVANLYKTITSQQNSTPTYQEPPKTLYLISKSQQLNETSSETILYSILYSLESTRLLLQSFPLFLSSQISQPQAIINKLERTRSGSRQKSRMSEQAHSTIIAQTYIFYRQYTNTSTK